MYTETENTVVVQFVLGDFAQWLHEDDLKTVAYDPYLLKKMGDIVIEGLNWTEAAEVAADEIRDLIAFGLEDEEKPPAIPRRTRGTGGGVVGGRPLTEKERDRIRTNQQRP